MKCKLKVAKILYDSKFYKESKQLITEIIDSNAYEYNYKLLTKLGDICKCQSEYNNAKNYYQQSINIHPNTQTLVKYATMLHYHLKNTQEAEVMYEKCLNIEPDNEECMFNYANLKTEQNEYTAAKELYIKCLKINNSRASVHFRYAKLLLKNGQNSDDDKRIRYLLQKAVDLQPTVAKYHQQFAEYLKSVGQYNAANQSYETALHLIDNDDMFLLYEYSRFLLGCFNNKKKAVHYLKMAAKLAENGGYLNQSYIIYEFHELNNSIRSESTNDFRCDINNYNVKFVVFEFDSIITYWDLWESIHGNIRNLNDLSTYELIAVFGGYDRIDRLHKHLQILSQNEIKIIILSFNENLIMTEALKRVKLYQYFSQIIGIDTSEFLKQHKSKINDIIKLKDDNEILSMKEILFIDHDQQHIKDIRKQCLTYHIPKTNQDSLRGPLFEHFDFVESVILNQRFDFKAINNNKDRKSLSEVHDGLYYDIKAEIIAMTDKKSQQSLYQLPSIQWINQNWKENNHTYKHSFLDFAHKFQTVLYAMNVARHNWWTSCQLFQKILKIESKDAEIYSLYAKCLSNMKHMKSADFYFNLSFKNSAKNIYMIFQTYSYHLLHCNKHERAIKCFKKCMSFSRHGKNDCNLCCGLARSLNYLGLHDEAEKYYQFGMVGESKAKTFYEPLHCFYGIHLRNQNKLEHAQYEFELCVKHRPHKAINYYRLSDVLLQLNDIHQSEYYLQKSLEIDPYLPEAKRQWKKYYKQSYFEDVFYANMNVEMKSNEHKTNGMNEYQVFTQKEGVIGSCYAIEFDRFWFDGLNIITETFNGYYDKLSEFGINDIRFILFSKEIQNDLKNKIGVNTFNDMLIIMDQVRLYRKQCKQFCNWMKDNKLFVFFYPILYHNAIYTKESFHRNVYDILCLENLVGTKKKKNCNVLIQQFWKAMEDCNTKKGEIM